MGEHENGAATDPRGAAGRPARDRTSVKWGVHGSDVIPMWIAEMDCAPCPAVVEAVSAAVCAG